jgi:excinuclease ABC subunit A
MLILAPVVRARKGTYQAVFDEIRKAGFVRVRVDGQVYNLDDEIKLDRYKIHTIEAVVDRLVLQKPEDENEANAARSRLADSVETALKVGEGYLTIQNLSVEPSQDLFFPSTWPARNTDPPFQKSNRAHFHSIPRMALALNARDWAASWKLIQIC